MTHDHKNLVVARPQALAVPERPNLPVAVAASDLLVNTLATTILVVTGETGGAGVDTLVGCLVALLDGASRPFQVIEVGTRSGYLRNTLHPEEYALANVANPDFVTDFLTAVASAPAGYPIIISVNAAAWKDFVHVEEHLRPWIDQAPERYCVLVKLDEWGEGNRNSNLYRKKGGAGRLICCFTQHPPGLRGGADSSSLRHDPDGGFIQVPQLSRRLQHAFYKEKRRLSSAMREASAGDAMLFASAMRTFASGLEDVL